MKFLITIVLFVFLASPAYSATSRTEAREEKDARRDLEEKSFKSQVEMNNKMDALSGSIKKLYEQQAITNALLRELIKLQAQTAEGVKANNQNVDFLDGVAERGESSPRF